MILENIESALLRKKDSIIKESDQKVKQIESYLARKEERTFDEEFTELKQIFKENAPKESIWVSLIKSKKMFANALTVNEYENIIQVIMPMFVITFSTMPNNDSIRINFRASELRCDYWMREAFSDNPSSIPNTYQEFLEYETPNKKYMDACKYLNRCEQFKADPTLLNYCRVSDNHFSQLAYINPKLLIGYIKTKNKAEEMVEQAVCQVKLAHSELEKYEYGISQIKEFYKSAIPEAANLLKTFINLDDRLIIENKPIENIIKNELLRQIIVSNAQKG